MKQSVDSEYLYRKNASNSVLDEDAVLIAKLLEEDESRLLAESL